MGTTTRFNPRCSTEGLRVRRGRGRSWARRSARLLGSGSSSLISESALSGESTDGSLLLSLPDGRVRPSGASAGRAGTVTACSCREAALVRRIWTCRCTQRAIRESMNVGMGRRRLPGRGQASVVLPNVAVGVIEQQSGQRQDPGPPTPVAGPGPCCDGGRSLGGDQRPRRRQRPACLAPSCLADGGLDRVRAHDPQATPCKQLSAGQVRCCEDYEFVV